MSAPLCLRGALRATASKSRPLVPTAAQALRHGGLLPPGPRPLTHASRRHAPPAAPAAAPTPAAPVDAPQDLSAEEPVAEKTRRRRLERIVRKQLEHMSDPWHIAQYVEQALEGERFDEALLLTQTASRDANLVVAWNHLIDYELRRDNIRPAIKLYNDMKKRGQLPNVQTFTIIFRGCARSNHPKLAIAEAMKHYNILLSDARLQPNSTHLNAVLQVCARAGDLDSLFLATESINESTRAPTAYTYTTIFNALRHHALHAVQDLPEEQRQAVALKALDRARGIWADVVDRWRRGRLVIDEELVCAMGRLLLLSRRRDDTRAVLDLLQQTMNIPNLAAASAAAADTASPEPASPETLADPSSPSDVPPAHRHATPPPRPPSSAAYAVPGRNTLALVLTALASAKLTTCGIKYWNLLVRDHAILPDADNWLRLLGMLKVARASAHAAAVLAILPDAHLGPKPFRIALDACVRDNINPRAPANAALVLDAMLRRLPVPDLHALRLYLRVALVSHYHMRLEAHRGRDQLAHAKLLYGRQIVAALDRLWDPYKRAHYHYFRAAPQGPAPAEAAGLGETYNGKREVIALARLMFSAFNKVRNERMLPDEEIRRLKPLNAKINREIQAFYANRETLEPRLRRRGKDDVRGPSRHDPIAVADLGMDPEPAAEDGHEDKQLDSLRRGGDFVWDTAKPVVMISREQRRQREWGKRSSSLTDQDADSDRESSDRR